MVSSCGAYSGPIDTRVPEKISLLRAARLSLQEALQRLDPLVIGRQRRVQLALRVLSHAQAGIAGTHLSGIERHIRMFAGQLLEDLQLAPKTCLRLCVQACSVMGISQAMVREAQVFLVLRDVREITEQSLLDAQRFSQDRFRLLGPTKTAVLNSKRRLCFSQRKPVLRLARMLLDQP